MSVRVRLKPEPLLTTLVRRNMSQNAFAREEAITSGHFTQMLNGTRYPGPVFRQRIMDGSGLAWDDLFEIVEAA